MYARALAVWVLIIVLESANGIVRRLIAGDDLAARQVGAVIGSAIVLAVALLTIRRIHPGTAANALAVGLLWVVLTVGFDLTLGSLAGLSWERIAADFDVRQGGAMPVGLAVMLFAPLLALSLRHA